MNSDEYALGFRVDLDTFDLLSDRTRHATDGGIGASDFGCREEMRRTLTRSERTDSPDKHAAIIGSYIDLGVKAARKAANPHLIIDAELTVTLYPQTLARTGGLRWPDGFTFPVHPDEIDPQEGDGGSVTDLKTKNGLEAIRRGLAEPQYRYQRHLQGLAAIQAGLVTEQVIVRNVFIDRSGADSTLHVEQEQFSPAVISEATDWLDDVLYAVEHDEETVKDRPRIWCEQFCQFYTACRAGEIEVEQITDPHLAAAVDTLGETKQRAKADAQLIEELLRGDRPLAGLTGKTERFRIASTWVNSARQQPHYRTEVKPL